MQQTQHSNLPPLFSTSSYATGALDHKAPGAIAIAPNGSAMQNYHPPTPGAPAGQVDIREPPKYIGTRGDYRYTYDVFSANLL